MPTSWPLSRPWSASKSPRPTCWCEGRRLGARAVFRRSVHPPYVRRGAELAEFRVVRRTHAPRPASLLGGRALDGAVPDHARLIYESERRDVTARRSASDARATVRTAVFRG